MPVLAAALALLASLLPSMAAPAAAADGDLRMAAKATYRVDPDDGVVRVRVDLTLTSLKPDSASYIYFFNGITLGIQDGARRIKATSRGSTLRTTIKGRDGYDEVGIRFPNLYYRQSRNVRLDFELPGGKPRSASDVRVGAAFTTFTAWAWGDDGRSEVTIVLPLGFTDAGYGASMADSTTDAGIALRSGRIAKPLDWYHVIAAERASSLQRINLGTTAAPIVVHAWPEDTAWQEAVTSTIDDGVPALQELIGLPWPVDGDLDVRQVHTPLLEGYAGSYESFSDTIKVSEEIDPQTILHEVAHAWFDADLLEDRFLYEGLAEAYSLMVASDLGIEVEAREPVTPADPAAFGLRDWPDPERIVDAAIAAREDFGYAASATVMQRIVEEVGRERMRDVLRAVQDGDIAYAGDAPRERHPGDVDWRRFLDLVQEIGEADGARDLFFAWVGGDQGEFVIRGRDVARDQYATLLEDGDEAEADGDGWAAPTGIRRLMADWKFDDARYQMNHASDVLEAWEALGQTEATLGVGSPDDVEMRYENALDEAAVTALTAEIGTRQASAQTILDADVRVAAQQPLEVQVGLLGEDVTLGVAAARAAYASGDLPGVASGLGTSFALLDGAAEVGRTRIIAAAITAAILLLLLVLVTAWLIRRRRRRPTLAAAVVADASSTLPGTPEPTEAPAPPAPSDLPAAPRSEPGAPPD